MTALHAQIGAKAQSNLRIVDRLQVVQLPAGLSVMDAVRRHRSNASVLYAEPDYVVKAFTTPNDPLLPQQWNLHNTGQNGGTPGADIHATQAWDIATGSSSVVVAVLDTGVDYTHQDLAQNIWSSADGFSVANLEGQVFNCPADSRGFNAITSACDPMDDSGHGSHVSGIIGAAGNNSVGVAGVNWNVQILPCKFLASDGSGLPVLRFNFRGAGRSGGVHDKGRGELDDVRAALNFLADEFPRVPILAAGFSFGSRVSLCAGCDDGRVAERVAELVGLGVPVNDADFSFLAQCTKPKLFLQGERDQYGAPAKLESLVNSLPGENRLIVVHGADHFFAGKLGEVDAALSAWLIARHPKLGQ